MFDAASAAIARTIVDTLRSGAAPTAVDRGAWQSLIDRAADGDTDAARALLNAAATADAGAAVHAACVAEARSVVLHDGSTVTLAEAQRLLLRAEEDAVAPELRRAIAAGWPGLGQFDHLRSIASSIPVLPPPAELAEITAAAPAFLSATEAVAEAAHQVLQNAARSPLERTIDVERAFDLPLPAELRGEDWLKGAVESLRSAAGRLPVPPIAIHVPATLAGCVLVLPDAVRFGVPAQVVRAQGLRASLAGAATAFVVARAPGGAETATGRAIAIGLLSEAGLRYVGIAPDVARATARRELAVGVLRARLVAAFVSTDSGGHHDPDHRDRTREAAGRALGVDASPALFDGLLAPLLPAVRRPLGRLHASGARDALSCASGAAALREAHDALFWVAPALWHALAEAAEADEGAPSSSSAGRSDADNGGGPADRARAVGLSWARGWDALCGECF